jgi:hypothetical protein
MRDNPILRFVAKSLLTALAAVFFMSMKAEAGFWNSSYQDYSRDASSMFYCASTGTVVTQAGVSISSPVISLYNPQNSGKNLVVTEIGVDITAAPAAAMGLELAYNLTPSSGVAGGVVGNLTSAIVGKSTSTATTSSLAACTLQGILPALPVVFRYLGGTTGASAISGVVFTDSTGGKIVVPPGGLISIQTTTAASLLAHFLWREDPL